MSSRETILEAVLASQPPPSPLPDLSPFGGHAGDAVQEYIDVFNAIGGEALLVGGMRDIQTLLQQRFSGASRILTTLPELAGMAEHLSPALAPHAVEDVDLAVIRAQFGVAENGAVWLTENEMGQRIVPYICQHLAVIIDAASIVPTLHEAYERIGTGDYGFGGFIAGPSKTADIEQALVLGAHGPLSMIVFIVSA